MPTGTCIASYTRMCTNSCAGGDREGVLPGDELTSINGMSMEVGRKW